MQAKLVIEVGQLSTAKDYAEAEPVWAHFHLALAEGTPEPTLEKQQQDYQKFVEALKAQGALDAYKKALAEALQPAVQYGILTDKLPSEHDAALDKIFVRRVGQVAPVAAPIGDVLQEGAAEKIRQLLEQKMPSPELYNRTFAWIKSHLPSAVSLKLNLEATRNAQKKAEDATEPVMVVHPPGDVIARAYKLSDLSKPDDASKSSDASKPDASLVRQPLGEEQMELIHLEYNKELAALPFSTKFGRALAVLGMYLALYVLCGFFIYRRDPRIITELRRFGTLLVIVVMAVGLMMVTSQDAWRAEVIPLALFGMTVAIAYQQEIALLLTAAITLVVVVALGQGLPSAVVLLATTASAILLLGRIRSRSKLLTVGFMAAVVGVFTLQGVGTLEGIPFWPLLQDALMLGLWAVIAGSLMSVLLPFVERLFGVQTDLSLIELGDPAHPLLQELIRRAGHLQPLNYRGLAGRIGRRGDRRSRTDGPRGRLFPRYW